MDEMNEVLDRVARERIIVIVRGLAPGYLEGLALALLEGGISMMEVTFDASRPDTWQDTAGSIRQLAGGFEGRILAGAGTVMNTKQVEMAAEAGARYIISPDFSPKVIQRTKELGLVSLPGALTPTEIVAAYEAGADAVKVFPAGSLGAGYIKAVKAPLSHIPLMAVGGVTEKNAADFLRAGAIGLGVGGNLVNKEWIEAGEWQRIAELTCRFRQAVDAVR